jgi:hypothetical protein
MTGTGWIRPTTALLVAITAMFSAEKCSAQNQGLVFDSFDTGSVSLVATGTATVYYYQPNGSVFNGRRSFAVFSDPAGTPTTVRLSTTLDGGSIVLSGSGRSYNCGCMSIDYGPTSYPYSVTDLKPYGDRFYFRLSQDSAQTPVSIGIGVDASPTYPNYGFKVFDTNGSGYYEFPFNRLVGLFGQDDFLRYACSVTFGVNFDSGPATVAISEWGVIPEPATISMLALGGLAMLRRRRIA